MDARFSKVSEPHGTTCKWLWENKEFLRWFKEDHGLFWIEGKPGCGKSTLMKYSFLEVRRRSGGRLQDRYHATVGHFFNARGLTIEKSLEGLYRTLAHHLLVQIPRLFVFALPRF